MLLAAVFAPPQAAGTGAGLRERRRIAVRYSGGWGSWELGAIMSPSLWAGAYRELTLTIRAVLIYMVKRNYVYF